MCHYATAETDESLDFLAAFFPFFEGTACGCLLVMEFFLMVLLALRFDFLLQTYIVLNIVKELVSSSLHVSLHRWTFVYSV